ncbi:hypothetical protein MKW92_003581 [Papaver armeniacum]|nr:hypothetical protein MKW92_003581 [Papaver armeniacum]
MSGNINFTIPSNNNFKLLETSRDFITTYTFVTHTAKHTFCLILMGVALTVNYVDPGTLKHIEVKNVDCKNWEKIFGDGG